MQITLDPSLKPWLIAAKDDTRPLLQHVQVRRALAGDEHGLLAATDTHRLIVVPCRLEQVPEEFESVLLPASWLALAHKDRPTGFFTTVNIDFERQMARALTKTGSTETPLGEGQFPNWLRVLEGEFSRKACPAAQDDWHFFPPKQLVELAGALGIENGYSVSWFQRQPTAPLVVLPPQGEHFAGIGLLMPGNVTLDSNRFERLPTVERWLFAYLGDGVLRQLEQNAAAEDLASQITATKEPVAA